ncbi:MAG: phosphonate C-P lyase system protein PhnG [Pseudomonadota bacterium]|nr:phosphonate C-P lyase system protein PhnG [Pseudomonadota bacterium]
MFHAFDNTGGGSGRVSRQQWMALLARAPIELMERSLGEQAAAAPQWLRRPETGLMMVQGRAGGTGDPFYLGEITVTRCALRAAGADDDAAVGVAYVLGRSHRQAQLAALCDALLQSPGAEAPLRRTLLPAVARHLADERARAQARADSTRVEFFTLARESDGGAEDEA